MRIVHFRVLLFFSIWSLLLTACSGDEPTKVTPRYQPLPVAKSVKTPVLMHYMPWFETPETNQGRWGIHWTMANRNPDKIIDPATGRREIASHFYPLTGPYASSDPDILEYQVLLMKITGIDGVVVDWYGTSSHADYPQISNNVEALIAQLQTAGLKFAFVYEDQSVKHAVDAGVVSDPIAQAKTDWQWMSSYFKSTDYIRLNNSGTVIGSGKPLVMTFGPQYFQTPSQWSTIISASSEVPEFLTLWYESGDAGNSVSGEFAWIYQDARPYTAHLDDFYARTVPGGTRMAVAFPGYLDFYREGGWGDNLFVIDHQETTTTYSTLQAALQSGGPVQLVTWNDYGEGTMFEPTVEFGYKLLENIQNMLGANAHPTDLLFAERLYRLRKQHSGNHAIQSRLDDVYGLLVSLRWTEADALLTELE